jgi:hypothetical protein
MKKLILSVTALAACSVGAYAQGTIAFDASSNVNTSPSATTSGEVFIGGVLDTSTDINAELLYSTSAGGTYLPVVTLLLSSNNTTATTTPGGTLAASGDVTFLSSGGSCAFFDNTGSSFILPVAAGTLTYFEVEGWTGQGTTYANAPQAGTTAVFTESLGGVGSPPSAAATLNNMPALNLVTTVVPEPSTLAMAGVGLASMLIFRRRNK